MIINFETQIPIFVDECKVASPDGYDLKKSLL